MDILLTIHGEVRWIVALIAIVALIRFAVGWLQNRAYRPMDRRLMAAYTGFMDLNLLLGLILLFGLEGGFPAQRLEHAATMILAIGVAHTSAAWRKSDDGQKKFRNNLIVVVVSLVLVFVGVWRLRGGWMV